MYYLGRKDEDSGKVTLFGTLFEWQDLIYWSNFLYDYHGIMTVAYPAV